VSSGIVHGIMVTHGDLGAEFLRTAESILGPQSDMTICSSSGKSYQTLLDSVSQIVTEKSDQNIPVVLFVDLATGGCGRACVPIASRFPEAILICGTNLAMLIEFLYHRNRVDLDELHQRIIDKGKAEVFSRGRHEDCSK